MKIVRDGINIELTDVELQTAFFDQRRIFQLEDAASQLENFFSNNCDNDEDEFEAFFGVEFDSLLDPTSENYLLITLANNFNENLDCNRAENDIWYNVVRDELYKLRKNEISEAQYLDYCSRGEFGEDIYQLEIINNDVVWVVAFADTVNEQLTVQTNNGLFVPTKEIKMSKNLYDIISKEMENSRVVLYNSELSDEYMYKSLLFEKNEFSSSNIIWCCSQEAAIEYILENRFCNGAKFTLCIKQ